MKKTFITMMLALMFGTAEKAQLRAHCQSLFCEEALRVIRLMPAWNPGSIGGRPARVKFTQSITFKL